jgi:hypothetical protein
MQDNPYAEFLHSEPRLPYFSYGDQFGGQNQSRQQSDYYQNQFSSIYNKYLGTLGRQARAATLPSGEFTDYLSGFDFDKEYRKNVPYETRTAGRDALVPRTRWMVPGINT